MTNAVVRGWGWSSAMGELSWGSVAVTKGSDTRDWWVSRGWVAAGCQGSRGGGQEAQEPGLCPKAESRAGEPCARAMWMSWSEERAGCRAPW